MYWHSKVSTSRLTAFNISGLIDMYFAQNHQLLEKSDVKLTSFCNFHFNCLQLTSLCRKILFKPAVKRLTSRRLTESCENDNVLWSHYASSLQWDSNSHKNNPVRKATSKKQLLFNIHPPVSPKSIFELTGVFHMLFHRHDNFTVITIVKKQE